MKPINDKNAKVLYNQIIAPGYCRTGIKSPVIAKRAKPGQFLEVSCSNGYDPLLRRPLSVHRVILSKGIVELLYCITGKGTRILSGIKPGEKLDIIGPLGNTFTVNPKIKKAVLIGGGMGVAPLLFWAEKLKELNKRCSNSQKKKIYVVIGAANKKTVLCEREFRACTPEVGVVTEDGSQGLKGLAPDMLRSFLDALGVEQTGVYACGPKPMLKAISSLVAKVDLLKCELSMEEYMGCGLGVCHGCAIKVRDGEGKPVYKMVCSDGPIFQARDIIWQY